jgi:hypothetical protein
MLRLHRLLLSSGVVCLLVEITAPPALAQFRFDCFTAVFASSSTVTAA